MSARDRRPATAVSLDLARMPQHVAVIMDGNRRWARERRLPAIEGHRRGVLALRELVRGCSDLGIPMVTVYAFSTENWKREALEISLLLDLLVQFAKSEEAELNRNGVRVRGIGRIGRLPKHQRDAIGELERRTSANDRVRLDIAINYSARAELADAARKIAEAVRDGSLDPEGIDESTIAANLYAPAAPDPDILIRTGGELRLSNFLLWQLAYTEIWVTERYWPDFALDDLVAAVGAFQRRARRFGGS